MRRSLLRTTDPEIDTDFVLSVIADPGIALHFPGVLEGHPFDRPLVAALVTEILLVQIPLDDLRTIRRHCLVDDQGCCLEVLFHQQGGNAQDITDRVESVAGVVGRKDILDPEIDPEEVFHGIAIFLAIEPADRDPPGIGILSIDLEDAILDEGQELITFLLSRLLLVRRWHEIAPDILPDFVPDIEVLQVLRDRLVVVHLEIPLVHAISMAVVAVVPKDGLDFLVGFLIRAGKREHEQEQWS